MLTLRVLLINLKLSGIKRTALGSSKRERQGRCLLIGCLIRCQGEMKHARILFGLSVVLPPSSDPACQTGGRDFVWERHTSQSSLRLWATVTDERNRPISWERVSFSPLTNDPQWGAGSSPPGRLASVKRQHRFSEGSHWGLGSVLDNVPT